MIYPNIIIIVSLIDREETPELQPLRAKMYKMLEESQHYSPDRVLDDFPTTVLLEERALILGRLKKHDEVLAIYIQVFGDVDKAKAYAEAKYEDDKEVFNILLLTILKPTQKPPYEGITLHPDFLRPNKEVAVDLLNTYTIKIDPTKIIEVSAIYLQLSHWPFLLTLIHFLFPVSAR